MKTLNKIMPALLLALGSFSLHAQQDPMYTHYMYNTLTVNPAYAGSRDALTVTALHRSQWVDFNGAPITQTVTAHAPLQNEHIGLGISVMNDRIGSTNNTSVFAQFAYIMKLNDRSKLALGVSGGANIFQAQLNSLELDEQSDPAFQNSVSNYATPNFGFGAYYYREQFYAGISTPNLLQNSYAVVNEVNGVTIIAEAQRHYFFIAGALFNVSQNLAFKPTTFVKVTAGAPVQADLTASFIIAQRLLLGAMYRTGDAFGALVGFDVSQQFHVGYSFDWSHGLKTSHYNKGSHEVLLRYDFIFNSKKQIHSPRNF